MSKDRAPSHDDRWGDHVPWSLRYDVVLDLGDFDSFMRLLALRLHRFFEHDEARTHNIGYFLSRLTSESLGHFTPSSKDTWGNMVHSYFTDATIAAETKNRASKDPEEIALKSFKLTTAAETAKIVETERRTRPKRHATHKRDLITERLEVLQSLFILLQRDKKDDALQDLIREVRRFAAESGVLLDIKGHPPTLVPLEEPLLQKEVLDRLLPRLEAKYPERAADLVKAYHDLLKGDDTNTVFGNAFKALEELAREISGVSRLELSERSALEKSFPQLHGTIRETIVKLAAHRGDEGAHGRKGPDEYEIRYLLFCMCNVALVLLEYKEHCG